MKIIIGLILVALTGLAAAHVALPSDQIQKAPLPTTMGLSGTTADSARAIAETNAPLTKAVKWPTADLGVYNSEKIIVDQDAEAPVGVPAKLLNFSSQKPIDLNKTSVGNVTGNVTVINGTMAWF
jgi:hypothetical protein